MRRGFRASIGDLGAQLGRRPLNVIASSLKTRFWLSFWAPKSLVIWATKLHAVGSNLAARARIYALAVSRVGVCARTYGACPTYATGLFNTVSG